MDRTRVYKIGNGAYYRNNFMPSSTTRQILEERLNGRGISTSSNSSWNFSNSYLDIPKSRKGKLWGIILMLVIFLVVLVVSGVAALALYMGVIRTDSFRNILTFDGSLRITNGDQYQQILNDRDSIEFQEKANQYSKMLKQILQKSIIGPSLIEVNIVQFENGSLVVHFRIHLDRRKIPDTIRSVENFLKKTITEKLNEDEFKNLKLDKRNVFIKRFVEQDFAPNYKTINRTKTKKTERKNETPKRTTIQIPTTTISTTKFLKPDFEITKIVPHFEPTTIRSETSTRIKFKTNTKLSQKINEIFRTEKPMNGHARPVSTSTEMLNFHTDEPWRPILLTTAINSLATESPVIKFTKKEPINIVFENATENLIKPKEENVTTKKSDPLGIDQIISGIKQIEETTTTTLRTIKNPFAETDNSRSSNILNFNLPIINQFPNLDNLFSGFAPTRFPARTKMKETTTEGTKLITLLPVKSNVNIQRPLRAKPGTDWRNRKSKYVIYVREIGKMPSASRLVMASDDYGTTMQSVPEGITDYADLETTTIENKEVNTVADDNISGIG